MCIIINFLIPLSIWLSSSQITFKNGPKYFTIKTAQVFIPFIKFQLQSLVLSSFLICLMYSFFYFLFHLRLSDGVCFQYYQVLVILLFSKHSDSFLFWQFYSFSYLYFSTLHYNHTTFFYAKFHSIYWLYILTVCIKVSYSFTFFANNLILSMYMR